MKAATSLEDPPPAQSPKSGEAAGKEPKSDEMSSIEEKKLEADLAQATTAAKKSKDKEAHYKSGGETTPEVALADFKDAWASISKSLPKNKKYESEKRFDGIY